MLKLRHSVKQHTGGKSKVAAGLLAIFLGAFGVHNFYLGYTGKAVAQLDHGLNLRLRGVYFEHLVLYRGNHDPDG